jgi:hypothetical protein
MNKSFILYIFLLLNFCSAVSAQDHAIVEVTGVIVTKNDRNILEYVPFVTVADSASGQGTYANYQGIYSIVVKKGATLHFTAVGFKDRIIQIPTDLKKAYYNLSVELEMSEIELSEITVFPWPDRDNLVADFLAMEPSYGAQLDARARKNLDKGKMLSMTSSSNTSPSEISRLYLQQQSKAFSYQGQVAPQPIFDPLAWGKFFNQWSKKKKKPATDKTKFD